MALQKVADESRARLNNETDADLLQRWQLVWDLEFKAKPAAQHDAVRKQMANDLARVVKLHPDGDAVWC